MRTNAGTAVWTELVVLVPYRASHVPKYHEWMQSAELRQLTASEPLTLNQEYAMQQSWLNDDDKCTFIVLDRVALERCGHQPAAMVGDVNLFLADGAAAEAEVMIAERWARGAGRGRQAAAAMLRYGVETLGLTRFEVKIGFDNEASQRMFAGMGFSEAGRSEVFREVTLEVAVTVDWSRRLRQLTPGYRLEPAPEEATDDGPGAPVDRTGAPDVQAGTENDSKELKADEEQVKPSGDATAS
ncbi:N-acetyltransferase 9-like isoform X2 [Amphibalanus amphitrite]|uniref:N-acetyltransferase 9-like isoform X2 n=1 Tax=Amphibalanus amphitrite TaxID=1232801 RepID=UPI001C9064CB|nr:N-acetyltransferase 9-like isoform X2 [Amphibalanus amphitrite]